MPILKLVRHVYLLGLCTAALLFSLALQHARAQDESLLAYAVDLQMRSWRGNGIYVGKGLVLTAAHVVGRSWLTRPKVVVGDQKYPTRTVKEGAVGGTDLSGKNAGPFRLVDWSQRKDGASIYPAAIGAAPTGLTEVELTIRRYGRPYVFNYTFSGVGTKY